MSGDLSNGVFSRLFNRNTNTSDVPLIVEGSDAATNGAAWTGIATNALGSRSGATLVVEAGTSPPASVSVQDTTPQSGAATNRFMRQRTTRP